LLAYPYPWMPEAQPLHHRLRLRLVAGVEALLQPLLDPPPPQPQARPQDGGKPGLWRRVNPLWAALLLVTWGVLALVAAATALLLVLFWTGSLGAVGVMGALLRAVV
jgi:hypothetical protein